MKYNPNIHHRRSIRLKGYNYAQAGLYFITICCQNRAHLFGEVENGKMILNDAGKMVEQWYFELENKFNDIKCHEMVIMPNHFHCIIENVGTIGADLRVCPNNNNPNNVNNPNNENLNNENNENPNNVNNENPNNDNSNNLNNDNGQSRRIAPTNENNLILGDTNILGNANILGDTNILGEHIGSPLHRVVQWFKTMTTNHYIRGVKTLNWQTFDGKLWQRNYYEHIIRNENDYNRIAEYILNNPKKWDNDKLK